MFILYASITVLIVILLIKLYVKLTCGKYEITEDLTGKIILITGASEGIGRCVTEKFVQHGATVHMLCRASDLQKAENVASNLKIATGSENTRVWEVDISRLQSVRKFVTKFLAEEKQPIDILINNAGVGYLDKRTLTEDNLELTMATNHFGHFLLTNLLLERLVAAKQGRILNIASVAHHLSNIDLKNLNFEYSYNKYKAYNISKLANVLFTNELAHRLMDLGSTCTANSLHPGSVNTGIFRFCSSWYLQPILAILKLFMKNMEEGVRCVYYVALSPDIVNGKYYWECGLAKTSAQANDRKVQRELWLKSEELTGLPSTKDKYPSFLEYYQ